MGHYNVEDTKEMFQEADADKSGSLSAQEFEEAPQKGWRAGGWAAGGGGWGWRRPGWGGGAYGWRGGAWGVRGGGWLQESTDAQAKPVELAQDQVAPEAGPGAQEHEVFLSVDTDGDGQLQLKEVSGFLTGMGHYSVEDTKEMFQEADADKSGSLSAQEFEET